MSHLTLLHVPVLVMKHIRNEGPFLSLHVELVKGILFDTINRIFYVNSMSENEEAKC